MEQTTIFIMTALGLMIVEILLIIKVIALTKTLQKMNQNIDKTQEFILSKIRAVVDLFIQAKGLGGSAEFTTDKTKINVKVKNNDK